MQEGPERDEDGRVDLRGYKKPSYIPQGEDIRTSLMIDSSGMSEDSEWPEDR